METGLEGKPWWVGVVTGLIVAVVAGALVYQLKLKEMRATIETQGQTLDDLREQIERGEAAQAQLPRFEEEVARLENRLADLVDILPDRRNVHALLNSVETLARDEDFNLARFTPGRQIEREYFDEWPITINLQGTYHNLAEFFDRIANLSRIINVDDLRIDALRDQQLNRTIGANFVAKTFVYRDPPPEATAPEAVGGPGP